jgi:hypothetical protein
LFFWNMCHVCIIKTVLIGKYINLLIGNILSLYIWSQDFGCSASLCPPCRTVWWIKSYRIVMCLFTDTVSQKLSNNNIFTIAKRNVEGQDMLYQSVKLVNGIWVLMELKIQPRNNNFTVSRFRINFQCVMWKISYFLIKNVIYFIY